MYRDRGEDRCVAYKKTKTNKQVHWKHNLARQLIASACGAFPYREDNSSQREHAWSVGLISICKPGLILSRPDSVSVSVSAQDGIVALGQAHTRSAPSLSSLPKVALETVPIFVWLNTDRSRPWRVECRPLPFSTPLSFRRSML